jgi:hypothetical protein
MKHAELERGYRICATSQHDLSLVNTSCACRVLFIRYLPMALEI